MKRFIAEFEVETKYFECEFFSQEQSFETEFLSAQVINAGEHYDGEYEIVPLAVEQVLDTADKVMDDDITVGAIPYYEVGNMHGKTAIIGG